MDIRACSVGADGHIALVPGDEPPELAGNTAPGEILLWMALYEPIPDPPLQYIEWLFALDLDGDVATGRPAGSARIDPDLGTEAAIGAFYDPVNERYEAYFLAWDPVRRILIPADDPVRIIVDDSRTVIGLALPLEALGRAGEIGVETRGRAAALTWVGETQVIDYCPERAE
jgi:hypothetical protein